MGVKDRYLESQKKKKDEANESKASLGVRERALVNSIPSRLEALQKEGTEAYNTYKSRFFDENGEYIHNYRGDTSDAYNSYSQFKTKYDTESKAILDLLDQYGDAFDADTATKISDYFSGTSKSYEDMLKAYKDDRNYWSKWKTEDDYNATVKATEDYEAMKVADAVALGTEIDALKAKRNEYVEIKNKRDNRYSTVLSGYMRAHYTKAEAERMALNDAEVAAYDKQLSAYGDMSKIDKDISDKTAYYNDILSVQKDEKYLTEYDINGLLDLRDKAESEGNADESMYFQSLADRKQVEGIAEILDKTKMDGEDVSVLYAMEELSYITDDEERQKREKAIKDKMASLNIDFDTYYSQITGESNVNLKGVGQWVHHSFFSGLDKWNKGISSTVDLILGKPLQALGWENNPISSIADYYAQSYAKNAYQRDLEAQKMGGGAFIGAGQLVEGVIAAVPDALMALMTAGASKAATATNLSTQAAYASGNALTKAGLTVQQMMKNPSYWSSFARTYGQDYEEAKAMGANDTVAVFGATISSLINAGIEIGIGGDSGIQGLAQDLTQGNKGKFLSWVESSLEEGGEEILQGFVNRLVAKTMYDENVEVANIKDMVTEGAMGTAVGAILGAGQNSVIKTAEKVAQSRAENAAYKKTGKYILDNGGTNALKELALQYASEMKGRQGKQLAKSANAISNDSKAKAVGKFAKQVGDVRSDLNKADIKDALVKRGMDKSKAENYANILAAMNEEYFSGMSDSFTLGTNEQWEKMTGDKDAYKIMGEVVTNDESSVNKRNKQTAYAVEGIRVDNEGKVNAGDMATYSERVMAKATAGGLATDVVNQFEVSEDGKTRADVDGASVEVTSKAFVEAEDGTLKLKVNGDNIVDANNVEYGDEGDSYVVSAIVDLGVSAEDANTLYGMFKGKGEQAGKAFANGITLAFKYGRYMQSADNLSKIGVVTEEQAKEAYRIGKKSRRSESSAIQSTLNEVAEANEKAGKKTIERGSIVFEGNIVDENGNLALGEDSLTDIQKASVNGLKLIAELAPINFHLFQSTKDGDTFTYVKENGQKTNANGWYKVGTNDIYIDLNAGFAGEGVVMYTAAHEISHFIKQYSPEKWDKVAEYIMNEYAAHYGSNVETLLMRQIAKVANREGSEGKTQREIEDEAFEELVCDSLSKMLIDGTVVQAMANIKKKNKGVWNTIKNAVEKLLKKWSAVIDQYRGRTPDAEEADTFKETSKAFKDLQKLFAEAFSDAGETYSRVGNLKSGENEMMSDRNTTEENKALKKFGNDIGTIERNADGDLLVATNKDNSTVMYSERTWRQGGKEKFISLMETLGHGDQAQEYAKYLDDALGYLHELAVGYEILGQHLDATITTDIKNGKQVLSAIVNNGEYPVNIDLALICKKRVAYMRLMAKMIEDGVFGDVKYDGDAIAEVNSILRKNGFETACLGCFVESRRLQFQTWAETIVQEWNEAVEARSKNAKYFRFTDGKASLTDAEIEALDNELENGGEKNDKGNLNLGQGSVADKMGRLLDKVPSLARKLTVDDLLTPQGLTALRATDSNLFSLVKQRYGAASPKIVQDYNPYASEIADLTFNFVKNITGNTVKGAQDYIKAAKAELISEQPPKSIPKQRKKESNEEYKARKDEFDAKKKAYNTKVEALAMRKYLYSIGGARIQSFSDFMIENVFDYLQIFADLSAKELPMHGYTKEIAALRLFGMTGAKWNGSLIAHVEKSMGKEYAGLLPASEAKNGNGILVKVDGEEYCIAFDDFARNKATNGESFIQSIGMKDIVALMYDPRYSANVGNITIGVSDKQIKAMLDSPLFRMVIPYHASGMLPQFAQLVGVDMYNDYTNYQNTTVKEVRLLDGVPYSVEIGDSGKPVVKNADGDKISIDTHYAFNEKLQKYGDARKTCQDYLAWCRNDHAIYDKGKVIGYATFNPKFSSSPTGVDFTKHRNYYKLIEDFNTYDNITENAAQQGAVTMTFPSAENRLTAEQKKAYEKALRDTGIFTEADIKKYLEKADMTFEDIVRAEVGNRKAYNDAQEPKFNSTVKEVEDYLLNAKDDNGNYKFRRDAVADTASDYIEGKKQGISLKPARGSYLDEVVLSDRDTAKLDADYMKAVEDGDMETVQRMVDEAAKRAGYTRKLYHGTASKFNVFGFGRSGIFATDNYDVAKTYGDNVVSLYGKEGANILTVDANKSPHYAIKVSKDVLDFSEYPLMRGKELYSTNDISRIAFAKGFDVVVIENVYDNFSAVSGNAENGLGTDVVYKDSNQVKSADPVTYDDDGSVIPLSKRFDAAEEDIRYSDRTPSTTSARALLANALESTIDTSTQEGQNELRKLKEYKEMASTLDELTSKLSELRSSLFTKGITAEERRRIQDEATKTANRISIYDKKLLTLEASKPLKNLLEREKAQAAKRQRKKDVEDFAAYKESMNETREKNAAKAKLQKLVLDTAKWISYPKKDDVKCPDFLRVPYAKFLESIDFSSKTLLEKGVATKNDEKMALAMGKLANAIDKVVDSQNPATDANEVLDSGYLDLPANFVKDLREFAEKTEALIIDGDFVINRMSSADIKSLRRLLKTLNHSIKEMSTLYSNLRFRNVEALGDNSISFMDELGEIDSTNAVGDFVAWDNGLPYYVFKRFGKGGESVFEAFMDAQDKLAYLAEGIIKYRESAWTDKEAKAWSDDTHTIELPSGKTITLTTADAMSIYCLARRDNNQGLNHLVGGGVRVIGQKKGVKTAKDSRVNLDLKDVQAICSSLDERQKAVAESIQEFMSTVCSEWGNEISMKRFLTKDFTEKRYFPIESNDEVLAVKDPQSKQSDLYRLLNISATKPLTPNANNSVIIRNIFDVFTEHSSDMARLNAFGMAMLDAMKWINYNEKTTNTDGQITVRGVRGAMQKAYGDKARSYVINLIKDINGRFNDSGDHPWLMKMTKQAKTAMVGGSLRVAALQFTALPRAAMVLSTGNIAKGLRRLPQISKAKKYCGISKWKSFGFYDTNISRSIEDQIKGSTNIRQKLIELSLKGAEWGDAITWGYLWNACEYDVASTNKELKVGSEEFNEAVGKRLREVVYSTQVVDSVLTRSQIMRNKSGLTQAATAFMSEPTLSANILIDAGFQFNLEKRRTGSAKAAWKIAGKSVSKAISVYTVGQLIAAIVEGLMDAYRDDDDDKFIEKFGREFLENAITDVVPFNKLPILADVTEMILSFLDVGYFSSDRLDTTWLTQMASALKSWKEVLGGDDSSTTYYDAIYKTTRALSTMTGLPVSNLMREVVTLWNNTAGAADPYLKIRSYESSSTHVDIAENAFKKGDTATVKKTVSTMVKEKVDGGKTEKEAKSAVKASFTARFKSEYVSAMKRGDTTEGNRIRKLLYATGLYGTLSELDATLKKWRTEK